LSEAQNKISKATVAAQLANAPGPDEKTKSGYPHRYENKERDDAGQPLFRIRTNSSTTSYREYPVLQSGDGYNYKKKPKDRPGPFRAVTNQNKTFKGTICHDGEPGNVAGGTFHRCKDFKKKQQSRVN